MLGLSRSPITSDRLVLAGELSPALPRPAHERAGLCGMVGLAVLPAPPLSSAPPPTADSKLLPSSSTSPDSPNPDRLRAWRSACPYIGSVRRGLTSALSPLIPTGSAPFPILIRFSERADVREDSDPGKRTWMKSPTLHGEGTPASVEQHRCSMRTRRGRRKDGVASETKVRRCCSLLVYWGEMWIR